MIQLEIAEPVRLQLATAAERLGVSIEEAAGALLTHLSMEPIEITASAEAFDPAQYSSSFSPARGNR